MHNELFRQFGFILGAKRLVFAEAMSPRAPEHAPSSETKEAENADANADIQAEITKNEGSAALKAARGKLQNESQAMLDKLSAQGKGAAAQVNDPAHSDRHMENVLRNAIEIENEIEKKNRIRISPSPRPRPFGTTSEGSRTPRSMKAWAP
jgi:small-conductance mechanosensitive channel